MQLHSVFFALSPGIDDSEGFRLLGGVPINKRADQSCYKQIRFQNTLFLIDQRIGAGYSRKHGLTTRLEYFIVRPLRRGGRAAECTGLENRRL